VKRHLRGDYRDDLERRTAMSTRHEDYCDMMRLRNLGIIE
jgi:hypothetical protein